MRWAGGTHTQSKFLNYKNCRNTFNETSSVTPQSVQKSKSHSCTRTWSWFQCLAFFIENEAISDIADHANGLHVWFLDVVDRPCNIWCCLIEQAPSGKILLNKEFVKCLQNRAQLHRKDKLLFIRVHYT